MGATWQDTEESLTKINEDMDKIWDCIEFVYETDSEYVMKLKDPDKLFQLWKQYHG